MAFSLSIDEMLRGRPRSALESMQQQQAFDQNRQKLAALIQQTQLANQASQLKMPYVAPKAAADIKELLARAAYQQQEANYVPTKYNIQQQNANTSSNNYNLQREINSPQMIQAILQQRLAQAQKNQATSNPKYLKSQQDLRDEQARALALQNADLNENGEPILTDEQRKNAKEIWGGSPQGKTKYGAYNLYYNKKDGETKGSKLSILSPAMKTQFQKQLVGFDNMSSIFPDLKQAATQGVLGVMTPHQNDIYQSFLSMTKEPGIGASQLPKIRQALKTLDDLFIRRKFTTKEDYLEKLAGVERTLTRQRDLTNKVIGRGGIIIPKPGSSHPDQDVIPKFTNDAEEREWYMSASPEQRTLYRHSIQHGGNR